MQVNVLFYSYFYTHLNEKNSIFKKLISKKEVEYIFYRKAVRAVGLSPTFGAEVRQRSTIGNKKYILPLFMNYDFYRAERIKRQK